MIHISIPHPPRRRLVACLAACLAAGCGSGAKSDGGGAGRDAAVTDATAEGATDTGTEAAGGDGTAADTGMQDGGGGGDSGGDDGGDGAAACPLGGPLPDLTVDAWRLAHTMRFQTIIVAPAACEIVEGCVPMPGKRRVLRFDMLAPNLGPGTFCVGAPPPRGADAGSPFVYDTCHMHNHLTGFAIFRLTDAMGTEVGIGHKQAACAGDDARWADGGIVSVPDGGDAGGPPRRYDCNFQGISPGWADFYSAGLACQWVDVTDVPEGDYLLTVEINPERRFAEASYDNNIASVMVHVPGPADGGADGSDDEGAGGDAGAGDDGATNAPDAPVDMGGDTPALD